MSLKIAIQPDEVIHPNGERQSFSARWAELAPDHDVEAVPVNAFSRDAIAQISACNAFMWRCPSSAHPRVYAQRLLYAIEAGLNIPVFPSLKSSWYYEDKLAQYYFFSAVGIPTPDTKIFWTRHQAEQFSDTADYPFVLKLADGHQSSNVRLVQDRGEAQFYIEQLFNFGTRNLKFRPASRPRQLLRRLHTAKRKVMDQTPGDPSSPSRDGEVQYGYFYAQEFLPDNAFEVSAIIIDNRAFACRRFIPSGDFRTSGSTGGMDWDTTAIDEDVIRLAYQTARKLDAQTVAVDVLRRGNQPIVVELTVNYASWVVHTCPGHWVLDGDPETGKLTWVDGPLRAEDAIFEDFVAEIHRSTRTHFPR